MRKQYHVHLTPEQRTAAQAVLHRGKAAALTARHARILLEADAAPRRRVRTDAQVAALCGVSPRTVARVRERCATDGFAVALHGRPHPAPPQARPRAGSPPDRPGLHRATGRPCSLDVRLLADARGAAGGGGGRSAGNWCAPRSKKPPQAMAGQTVAVSRRQANAAFVAAMEDILTVYAAPSIRPGPWSASTRRARSQRPRRVRRSRPRRDGRRARIALRAQRGGQSVFGLCPAPGLAPGLESPSSARPPTSPRPCAGWSTSLSRRRADRAGHRQPQHPSPAALYQAFPPPKPGASWRPGVALHAHAWQLAQHGRAGAGGAQPAVSGATHPRPCDPGDRRWPPGWQQRNAEQRAPPRGTSPQTMPASACLALPLPWIGHFHHVGVLSMPRFPSMGFNWGASANPVTLTRPGQKRAANHWMMPIHTTVLLEFDRCSLCSTIQLG